MNEVHHVEHIYIPVNQNSDATIDVLQQQICTIQTEMKQLANRVEHTEQTIVAFTQQLAEMADTDMVIIRS